MKIDEMADLCEAVEKCDDRVLPHLRHWLIAAVALLAITLAVPVIAGLT